MSLGFVKMWISSFVVRWYEIVIGVVAGFALGFSLKSGIQASTLPTLLLAVLNVVGLVMALGFNFFKHRRDSARSMISHMRYFYCDRMIKVRKKGSKFIKNDFKYSGSGKKENRHLDEVLNFMEILARDVREGLISPYHLWHYFWRPFKSYYESTQEYRKLHSKENPELWKDFAIVVSEIQKYLPQARINVDHGKYLDDEITEPGYRVKSE